MGSFPQVGVKIPKKKKKEFHHLGIDQKMTVLKLLGNPITKSRSADDEKKFCIWTN